MCTVMAFPFTWCPAEPLGLGGERKEQQEPVLGLGWCSWGSRREGDTPCSSSPQKLQRIGLSWLLLLPKQEVKAGLEALQEDKLSLLLGSCQIDSLERGKTEENIRFQSEHLWKTVHTEPRGSTAKLSFLFESNLISMS